jgi:hypothetical protein
MFIVSLTKIVSSLKLLAVGCDAMLGKEVAVFLRNMRPQFSVLMMEQQSTLKR